MDRGRAPNGIGHLMILNPVDNGQYFADILIQFLDR